MKPFDFETNYSGELSYYAKRPISWIQISIFLVGYVITKILQCNYEPHSILNIALLHIQILLFTVLILTLKKLGLLAVICINVLESISIFIKFLLSQDYHLLSLVIIPINLILCMIIVYLFVKHIMTDIGFKQQEMSYLLRREINLYENELEEQKQQHLRIENSFKRMESNLNQIPMTIEWEADLLHSINNEELYLLYQPIYSAADKQLRGLEALTRWHSQKYGLINPSLFIPCAEKNGFIIPLGEWIFRTACEKLKEIKETYRESLIMSINISAVQLMDASFIPMVTNILQDTGIEGSSLELEITESFKISSFEHAKDIVKQIKKMGIRIALDDFGTGYSSFLYLDSLPVDTIKIDQNFIKGISSNQSDDNMAGYIISLIHELDMKSVAEGVENEEQLTYLREQACDFIQGFLWGKPLNESELHYLFMTL